MIEIGFFFLVLSSYKGGMVIIPEKMTEKVCLREAEKFAENGWKSAHCVNTKKDEK